MYTENIRALLLAAGEGSRLKPLTDDWPKCLMPIEKRPLLEYWLETLYYLDIRKVLVNLHHHATIVEEFLHRDRFLGWVKHAHEENLLGTAGTLRKNNGFFVGKTILLIHADNWCRCDFKAFIDFHFLKRPSHCPITMMTFETDIPESCGIVELNKQDIVIEFYEKIKNPPGNKANGAVYLLEPEVLEWIEKNKDCKDFSTEVLTKFIGRIATWHNTSSHLDIGTVNNLTKAQLDFKPEPIWKKDKWQESFEKNSIHKLFLN